MTKINEIRTEIAEGNLLTTLVFDDCYGWHWYASDCGPRAGLEAHGKPCTKWRSRTFRSRSKKNKATLYPKIVTTARHLPRFRAWHETSKDSEHDHSPLL